jgi:glycosyltransferase involved in cell wall biosynthesis
MEVGMETLGPADCRSSYDARNGDWHKPLRFHLWSPVFSGFGGGIAAFSRELASGLYDLGHDLRLIGKLDTPGQWHGSPLWGMRGCSKLLQSPGFAAGALASCARYRPDHLISIHLNFGPVARLAKRAFGTPFTLVAHGIDVHDHLSCAKLAALRAADLILAVSSWTRERVLEVGGIDPSRVAVLPNTFDELRFTVAGKSEWLATRYNLQTGEKVLLTVARLDSGECYKGYDRIMQALPAIRAACGPVRFLVVGKGDDRTRLERMARRLNVEHAVSFAGFVPDEELADHYRLADVFAMPSTGDGFGIVFLEAMACGTPVLAGNCDGSVDALDGGRLGQLVDPNDVDAIARGITSLLKRQGPEWWFDRHALHDAVIERFGRAAFRRNLQNVFHFNLQ